MAHETARDLQKFATDVDWREASRALLRSRPEYHGKRADRGEGISLHPLLYSGENILKDPPKTWY